MVVRLGLEVEAASGPCSNIRCGFPFPENWPEQSVRILDTEVKGPIKGVMIRDIGGGVRQARFLVSRLAQGQKASVAYIVEISRKSIDTPVDTAQLVRPKKIGASLRKFLGESPYIETNHPMVKAEAAKLDLSSAKNDWERVLAIRRHTLERVKYTGVKSLAGALKALKDGGGDCEERTSVFVALCRNQGIPARSVWIPEHAYAEFYLQDSQGKGHWFPCESVGGELGVQHAGFLILQKGDRFRDPLRRGEQRYLSETASGILGRGAAAPVLRPIKEEKRGENWAPLRTQPPVEPIRRP